MPKRNKNQNKSVWLNLFGFGSLAVFTLIIAILLRGRDIALLNPKGQIADEQTRLLVLSTLIMLAFAAVILSCIYFFAWRYRESNGKTIHNPAAGRSKLLIFTAWASPIAIFVVLTAIMLPATQKLAPQRSIQADNDEITIRVVAMRWKWLFMYPEHGVASVNYVQIPVDTPVRFELTADEAPMQSFWIPHLGGMLYAMTEHVNPLNLMAHTVGDYNGGAAEINGRGLSGMRFIARVSSSEDFDSWVSQNALSADILDAAEYARLLEPDEDVEPAVYSSPANQDLFTALLSKYGGSHHHYAPEPAGHGGHH